MHHGVVHLHAEFVPPTELRQALGDLVRGLEPAVDEPVARRGLLGRRTAAPAAVAGPQLVVEDVERMVLPITDFGYLASTDAHRVVDALDVALADLPAPRVRLGGGAALVDEADRCVWAELTDADGDSGGLREVAQRVVSALEPLGLFRDRRQFKTRFAIATITDDTTLEHLEAVLAALESYDAEPWLADEIVVLQRGSGPWRSVTVGSGRG
jgi:hypothetical protein